MIFLTQPLRLLKAFVVVTSRFEDARISEHAAERLNRMARNRVDVRLRELAPETVHAPAERAARRSIGPEVQQRLVALSGGSPLVVLFRQRSRRGRGSSVRCWLVAT